MYTFEQYHCFPFAVIVTGTLPLIGSINYDICSQQGGISQIIKMDNLQRFSRLGTQLKTEIMSDALMQIIPFRRIS